MSRFSLRFRPASVGLSLFALLLSISFAQAQQAQSFSIYGPVSADLRVGSAAVSASNPVPVSLPSVAASPTTTQVVVPTTGAVILTAGRSDQMVDIVNTSTTVGAYFGPPGINSGTGHYLPPGGRFTMDNKVNQGQMVAISASGTITLTIFRF